MKKRVLKSEYAKLIREYVNQRITDGFSETSFTKLYQFDWFLYDMNYTLDYISKEIVDSWCLRKDSEYKNNQNKRISVVRKFCIYLNTISILAYVPKHNSGSYKPLPYVLTYEENILFFKTLDNYFKTRIRCVTHYRYMIPVIMRLLYLCGLRNGEACFLRKEDIIHKKKALKIIDAKNHKDRIVYMHDQTYAFLMTYICKISDDKPSVWLFPSTNSNKPISNTSICEYFTTVLKICDIGCVGYHPTPHSLRHTFVVHIIDAWIGNEENVNELMPYLSKQLGHSSISGTYYYYHMIASSYKNIRKMDRNIYPEVELYEEE